MKFGIIIFPGSNCDQDSYHAAIASTGEQAAFLWHESHDLQNSDAIVVPGGFAYGDYMRTGAIAKFAPIMQEVEKFAASGGLVTGICNEGRNVLGMMPHPDRSSEAILGSSDGAKIFKAMATALMSTGK